MLIFQSFIPGQILFFVVPVSIQHNSSEGTLIQTCSTLIKIKYSVEFYSEIYYSKPMQLPPYFCGLKKPSPNAEGSRQWHTSVMIDIN